MNNRIIRHAATRSLVSATLFIVQNSAFTQSEPRVQDVTDGAAQSRRAAWSYEAARAGMQQVDHWIAFWEDVEIK